MNFAVLSLFGGVFLATRRLSHMYMRYFVRDLVPFEQFKKREKQPWRSVIIVPATLLKLTLIHGFF